jgi:hypothetical protein
MIELNKTEWNRVWSQIKSEHPRSVWLLSYKLKEVLGFTVRKHKKDLEFNRDIVIDGRGFFETTQTVIYLDFYDEQMEVYFRLKYL